MAQASQDRMAWSVNSGCRSLSFFLYFRYAVTTCQGPRRLGRGRGGGGHMLAAANACAHKLLLSADCICLRIYTRIRFRMRMPIPIRSWMFGYFLWLEPRKICC